MLNYDDAVNLIKIILNIHKISRLNQLRNLMLSLRQIKNWFSQVSIYKCIYFKYNKSKFLNCSFKFLYSRFQNRGRRVRTLIGLYCFAKLCQSNTENMLTGEHRDDLTSSVCQLWSREEFEEKRLDFLDTARQ